MIIRKTRAQVESENELYGDARAEGAHTTEEMREAIRAYISEIEGRIEYNESLIKIDVSGIENVKYQLILYKEQLKVVKSIEAYAASHKIEYMADMIASEYEAAYKNMNIYSIYSIAERTALGELNNRIVLEIIEEEDQI